MAIGYIKRLAGPYIGDGTGQKTFSFGFFVFTEGDVYVATAATENGASSTLQQGTDYTVTLNADQEASPGGTITLTAEAGLADGAVLVIGSDVDYTQTLDLTNYTRFPPERITRELDRIVVQIQQLKSESDRALKTDETDTQTPAELKEKLLKAAESAFTVASQKAEEAKSYAQEAANSAQFAADTVADLPAQTALRIEEINAAAQAAGDHEIERIRAEGDNELIAAGLGCGEVTWTLTDAVASGSEVTIPGGIKYLAGRKHLRMAWNGVVLYRGQNFDEVGQDDAFSTTIKLLFDAQAGDELNAWVGALGKGEIADAVSLANQALDSVSALSQRVVYKDEQAAE